MTELSQRCLEDLRLRNYAPKTLPTYIECVSLFAQPFKRSLKISALNLTDRCHCDCKPDSVPI